jgi:hypothetical protein
MGRGIVSDKKKSITEWIGTAVLILIPVFGWVFAAGAKSSDVKQNNQDLMKLDSRVSTIEKKLETDHDLTVEMHNDVKWLKRDAENRNTRGE